MPLHGFAELFAQADANQARIPVAVAGGADSTVLEALRAAHDRGWITPLVFGEEADIRRVAFEDGVSLAGFTVTQTEAPAVAAVAEVRAGRARLLMKGQIATPHLMRAVLDAKTGLRTARVICQIVLLEVASSQRRFLLADTGIVIQPTLEQKGDMLKSCVEIAHALGADLPRVALMAATETVAEAMPETVEAAELVRRAKAAEFPGCVVQGPLSFDLAYASEAAGKKGIEGPAAGAADILLFPNLLSANLTVKAIMYTAACRFGGILAGAACPVIFMSRADTTETRLNSLALALKMDASTRN